MADVRRFTESGFRVTAVAEAEAALRRLLLPDPGAALSSGRLLKRSRYRAAARIEADGLGPVIVKVHRPSGVADTLRAAVRRSRASSEWRAARCLAGAGIPTPEILGSFVRRRGPLLAAAATAARFVPDRDTFAPALNSRSPREAKALLVRAAGWIRAMHDRGIEHRDLHSGNVLVARGPAESCEMLFVDLHKAQVGRPVPGSGRVRDLAQWLHSLAEAVGPGGRLRSLLAYAGVQRGGARPTGFARFVRRVERAVARRERVRIRSRSRRCVEENTDFTRSVGEGAGWRRLDVSVAAVRRAIAAHDRVLSAGPREAVVKRGRKSSVTRDGGVVVKESFRARTLLTRLARLAVPDLDRAGYENAHRLLVRSIATARPLAFVRRGGRTITLYEDLGRFPRLDHRVRAALRSGEWDRARLGVLLRDHAAAAARVHRKGVWHGDWKGCNWLVDENPAGFAFHLVDTDRVKFYRRPVPWRRRMRNLAQLAASIPMVVSRTDRLRWWRRYAEQGGLSGPDALRRAARDVAALVARKTVVVDEPIE